MTVHDIGGPLRHLAEANRDAAEHPTVSIEDVQIGDVVRMVARGGRLTGRRTVLALDDMAIGYSSLPPMHPSLNRRCLYLQDEDGECEVGWWLRIDHVVLVERPTVDAAEFAEALAATLDGIA